MRGLNIKKRAFKTVFRLSVIINQHSNGYNLTRVLNELHSQALKHLYLVWVKLNKKISGDMNIATLNKATETSVDSATQLIK